MVTEKKKPEVKDAGTGHLKRSLRDDAEKELARSLKRSPDGKGLTTEASNHELQVYQIELEMQAEELRRAHLKLEESRDKYLDLFEFAPIGYLTLNNQVLITEINLTGAVLLGVERSRLVNARFRKFIAPADLDPWDRYFANVLKDEGKLTCTLLLARGDGSVFPARLEGVRTSGNDGTPMVRIAISDISEIRLAEKEKAENDSFNRGLVENLPDYIIIYGPDGKIRYVNPSSAKALGYDADSLIGTSLLRYVAEEYQDTVISRLARRQEGGDIPPYEIEILIPGGLRRSVIVRGTHIEYHATPATLLVLIDITDRQRMETALRESEENLRKVFENSAIGMTLTLPDFRFQLVNPAWVSMMGYTEEEFRKMSFKEITHPDDLSGDIENIRALTAGTIPVYSTEKRYIRKDGSTLWGALKVTTVRNSDGTLRNYLAQIEDITSRKQAEELLRESENKFATVFKSNPVSLTLVSAMDGRFIDANDAFVAITGYSRKEVVGRTSGELGLFPNSSESEQMISQLQGTQHVEGMELQVRKKTGEVGTCRFSSGVILMGGRPYILSTLEDITERKEAEEALQESEKRYRDMFELNRAVMLIINPETGWIVNANSAASQYYGYSREEFSRLLITDINISDPAITMKNISYAVGNKGASFTFRHRKKNGEISDVDVFSAPITLGGRQLLHSIIQDVTERTLAEEALKVANRKLNLLSGITRHDIRNQLLALGGYLEISKSSLDDMVATSEFIAKEEKIAETIAHQITFTKDYEDLGMKVPVWQNVKEVLKKVTPRLPLHTIRLDAEDSLPEIYADPLLEKVFYNLIDNALRYGGEKMAVIRVTSQQDYGGRIIAIEDDGNGISGEDKKQLFTRGFGKHTGLGLYLSREILSITGITITETGKPGAGARFEILVPNGMWRTAGAGRNPD